MATRKKLQWVIYAKNPFTRPFGKTECKDNKKFNNLLYFDIIKRMYLSFLTSHASQTNLQKLHTPHT